MLQPLLSLLACVSVFTSLLHAFTADQLVSESASAHLYSGQQGRNYLLPDDALAANSGDLYAFTSGLLPSGRVKHVCVFSDPFVVVLGGYAVDGTLLDDVQLYDTRSRRWSGVVLKRQCCNNVGEIIETSGISTTGAQFPQIRRGFQGDLPLPRAEHAAVAAQGLVWVFGGQTSYLAAQDLYAFDPVAITWRVLDKFGGRAPPRRAGHSMLTSGGTRLVVFGGRGLSSAGAVVGLNDVWSFDTRREVWSDDSNKGGTGTQQTPIGRQYAAAACANGYLIIVGGIDPVSSVALNDVWAFHLGLKTWQLLSKNSGATGGFAPPPLYHASLLPVTKLGVGLDGTGTLASNFLLYGGVGGGGACGGPACSLAETVLGQVYQLTVTFASNNAAAPQMRAGGTALDGADSGVMTIKASAPVAWAYARLTGAGAERGRLIKTYGMESTCFDQERGVMYEVGGMQAQGRALYTARQAARQPTGPSLLDAGESFPVLLWDTSTGEHLRQTAQQPVNGPWTFQDGFSRFQPLLNASLSFLSASRSYSVTPTDMVLVFQETVLAPDPLAP